MAAPSPASELSCASAMQVSGRGLLLSKSRRSSDEDLLLWKEVRSHPGADRSTRVLPAKSALRARALQRPLSPGLLPSPSRGKRCDAVTEADEALSKPRGVRPLGVRPLGRLLAPRGVHACAELEASAEPKPEVPRSMLTEASVARHERRNDDAPLLIVAGAGAWPCAGASDRLEAEQSQVSLRRWVGREADDPLVLSLAKGLLHHPSAAPIASSLCSAIDLVRRRGDVAQAASVAYDTCFLKGGDCATWCCAAEVKGDEGAAGPVGAAASVSGTKGVANASAAWPAAGSCSLSPAATAAADAEGEAAVATAEQSNAAAASSRTLSWSSKRELHICL